MKAITHSSKKCILHRFAFQKCPCTLLQSENVGEYVCSMKELKRHASLEERMCICGKSSSLPSEEARRSPNLELLAKIKQHPLAGWKEDTATRSTEPLFLTAHMLLLVAKICLKFGKILLINCSNTKTVMDSFMKL